MPDTTRARPGISRARIMKRHDRVGWRQHDSLEETRQEQRVEDEKTVPPQIG